MRRFLVLPVMLIALALGGCAGTKIGDLYSAVTTTITNPVTPTNIEQVKAGLVVAEELAVAYRRFCYSNSYKALMDDPFAKPICQHRRDAVRAMQTMKSYATRAIAAAEKFVRENPSGNAASYISAAWSAVTAFKAAVPPVSL